MLNYNNDYWEEIKNIVSLMRNPEALSDKSILITGATGMICSTVVDILWFIKKHNNINISVSLAGRDEKKMIVRFPFMEKDDYHFFEFDTSLDYKIFDRFDYIIHGAGNADPNAIMKEPVETILTNVLGLKSLFGLLKDKNARLVFISSSEVYGRNIGDKPIKEDEYGFVDILNPRACYPNAKRISETMCAAFKEEYGKDSVIVRPGHVYGPSISNKDSRASAEFTRKAFIGEDIVLKGTGEKVRSYVYTLDCASAIITVMLYGDSLNAYNISNPDSVVSIKEFATQMATEANVDLKCEMTDTVIDKSGNLMDNSSVDSKKLLSLGWKPYYNLEKGVKSTLKYYVEGSDL